MKLLDNRQTLKFPATDRHLSGIYECIASNGVGTPAKAKIELSIICKYVFQYHRNVQNNVNYSQNLIYIPTL